MSLLPKIKETVVLDTLVSEADDLVVPKYER
jgi:hypothetical protein